MKALLELERLGFSFALEGDNVRYIHRGERPEPEAVQPLLEEVRAHREDVVEVLRDRSPLFALGSEAELSTEYPVTLRFSDDAHIGVVDGQWKRLANGQIEATFPSREVLALALVFAYDAKRRKLEDRLACELEIMTKHQGSAKELSQLQRRFTVLLDEHQAILNDIRVLKAEANRFSSGGTGDSAVSQQEDASRDWQHAKVDISDLARLMHQDRLNVVAAYWDGDGPVTVVLGEL